MNPYDNDRPRRKFAAVLFLLVLIVAGLAAGAWYLRPRFESEPPQIVLKPDTDTVGTGPVDIVITDSGTGLKSLEVKLGDATIASEQFAQPVAAKTVTVVLSKLPGVKEGPAMLRVVARDASLFRESDYWQHPHTFEQLRRGDCEDFALWAWRKLIEIGIDADLVIGRRVPPQSENSRHAWILFRRGGDEFLFEPVLCHRERSEAVRPVSSD